MYKNSKWAKEIIAQQNSDGLWGYFHTLSEPSKYPLTTEQALRRLKTIGYTMDDEPVLKAVSYMSDCLSGKKVIPDRREKTHDWDIFTELMLSTWVRQFTLSDDRANSVAAKWAHIIGAAVARSEYDDPSYVKAYFEAFGKRPKGSRLVDFVSFYQVSLVADQFDEITEKLVFEYVLRHESGLYYIYDKPISELPEVFQSKNTSRYLGAIENLAAYRRCTDKLRFAVEWLNNNRNENSKWDLGPGVNDKVYFPLSDDWRIAGVREDDCTYRIQKLLDRLR